MPHSHFSKLALPIALATALAATAVQAGDNGKAVPVAPVAIPIRVQSLRGIEALAIDVEGRLPVQGSDTVPLEQLWKDAALRLRLGGVQVLETTTREGKPDPKAPVLMVSVNVLPASAEDQAPAAYSVMLELRQRCTLERNPGLLVSATVWRTSSLYRGGSVREGLRNAVRDLADDFLNDYLAANPERLPKPQAAPAGMP